MEKTIDDVWLFPTMEKTIGNGWRVATMPEITDLRALDGAPHAMLGCTCCGMVNWSTKNIAIAPNGSYNGARRITRYSYRFDECSCPPSALRCVVES